MGTIRVVLAEGHVITRQGIRRLIEDETDLDVVGEASDGEEAVRMVEELQPDVIVMAIALPQLNGIEATRQIRLLQPQTEVLILSAYDDDEYVFASLRAGAAGFVLKNIDKDGLVRAIRAVHRGDPALDPGIARKVINYLRVTEETAQVATDNLTSRERDVLRLAARGLTNKDIAGELSLSKRTVEGHLRTAFEKLGADSRTEAVMKGIRKGWITAP